MAPARAHSSATFTWRRIESGPTTQRCGSPAFFFERGHLCGRVVLIGVIGDMHVRTSLSNDIAEALRRRCIRLISGWAAMWPSRRQGVHRRSQRTPGWSRRHNDFNTTVTFAQPLLVPKRGSLLIPSTYCHTASVNEPFTLLPGVG
jgi:hypothetical protein